MTDPNLDFAWHPLPARSQRRLDWGKIYAPMGIHAGAGETQPLAECTPQRLSGLKKRANETLAVVGPEFAAEADRLRRERYYILCAFGVLSLIGVALGCLVSTNGYELLKSMLTVGGAGGLMTWGVTLAFKRLDHEAELRLLPKVLTTKIRLSHNCEMYENTLEWFSRATESLRVQSSDTGKQPT